MGAAVGGRGAEQVVEAEADEDGERVWGVFGAAEKDFGEVGEVGEVLWGGGRKGGRREGGREGFAAHDRERGGIHRSHAGLRRARVWVGG